MQLDNFFNKYPRVAIAFSGGSDSAFLAYSALKYAKEVRAYFEDYGLMLCGDFVFKEDIGRVDLPSGSFPDMIQSIKKLKTYNDDIILYPGHGEKTTIGHEKKHNKYFI